MHSGKSAGMPTLPVASPPELLEDPGQVFGVYARAAVGDLYTHAPVLADRSELDRRALGRILGRVGKQVAHDLSDALGVGEHTSLRPEISSDHHFYGVLPR